MKQLQILTLILTSKDVVKVLNFIGANFLSLSDKKALNDLIHEYFGPWGKRDIMNFTI